MLLLCNSYAFTAVGDSRLSQSTMRPQRRTVSPTRLFCHGKRKKGRDKTHNWKKSSNFVVAYHHGKRNNNDREHG